MARCSADDCPYGVIEQNVSHIPPDKIEEVRQASDIVEVVSGYLSLRSSGKNHFGLCPFHTEKTPSFSVNTEMQIFHCFGCGAGGNVFTFIMMIEKITFPEAERSLAQQAGIVLPQDEKDLDDLREKEALFIANTRPHMSFSSNNLLTSSGRRGCTRLPAGAGNR
jgi:DNA primase catalytic core